MNNILIIDDSIVDCKIMEYTLKRSNSDIKILFNHDGKNVLEQLTSENISVVILDLMIENINGIDLLKLIKMNKATADLPVIVCSGIRNNETIKETLLLGAYDYFEKPLSAAAIEFGFYVKVKNAMAMKKKIDHVEFIKNHDELTGLGTRKYFETELQNNIDQGILPLSVIIVDINGLKVINDAYGHDVGDNALREISEILKNLNPNYYCISRWGSDEMVILMPKDNGRSIDEVVKSIKRKIGKKNNHYFDISFGWATEANNLMNAKYLMQRAEDSLYRNKILEPSSIRRNMIDSIVKTLQQKNPREEMHSQRVSFISEKIATELGFSEYEKKRVKLAGLMHDIGKISIDEEVLNKPGRLKDEEWLQIKKHPENGFKILSTSVDTMEIANAILAHHERWDGGGYPKGIAKDNIPIMARIIAVADTFDAMTSLRPYKNVVSEIEAIEEIKNCAGTQFDTQVVEAFLRYNKNRDFSFNI